MAQQIVVTVYGLNKKAVTTPYLDAFPADAKFSDDKLPGTPIVYSRIDYELGGEQMSAYVIETVAQLVALANA